ncbi:protein of unknown function [Methylorubrum extorquens DM4]|uniref:Uncharacterized protein n=1 Tax=Methylorubrum extorquens (strain DSM 6343 / CIP 106787 / DM4) TaxID=661410 RepID=C7CH81_METED|nr:protein of unknown function [Methylorubrum extorquens DM4]
MPVAVPRHVLFLLQPAGLSRLDPHLRAAHGHPDRNLPGILRWCLADIMEQSLPIKPVTRLEAQFKTAEAGSKNLSMKHPPDAA